MSNLDRSIRASIFRLANEAAFYEIRPGGEAAAAILREAEAKFKALLLSDLVPQTNPKRK